MGMAGSVGCQTDIGVVLCETFARFWLYKVIHNDLRIEIQNDVDPMASRTQKSSSYCTLGLHMFGAGKEIVAPGSIEIKTLGRVQYGGKIVTICVIEEKCVCRCLRGGGGD